MVTENATILFDGVCNLCNASVNFIIDRDPDGYFKFASLQSNEAEQLLKQCDDPPEALASIVLIEDGHCYSRSTAALRIARHLTGNWPLLYGFIVVPRSVRDAVYNWVAKNRYHWFGKRESCRVPTPELEQRFLEQAPPTVSTAE